MIACLRKGSHHPRESLELHCGVDMDEASKGRDRETRGLLDRCALSTLSALFCGEDTSPEFS